MLGLQAHQGNSPDDPDIGTDSGTRGRQSSVLGEGPPAVPVADVVVWLGLVYGGSGCLRGLHRLQLLRRRKGLHQVPRRREARILSGGLLDVLPARQARKVGGHHLLPVPRHQQVLDRVIEFRKERPLGQGVDREEETAAAGKLAE